MAIATLPSKGYHLCIWDNSYSCILQCISLYVPIPATSLVCPRDIKFSEAWQLSGSDDEDKDINRRAWKGIRQIVTLETTEIKRWMLIIVSTLSFLPPSGPSLPPPSFIYFFPLVPSSVLLYLLPSSLSPFSLAVDFGRPWPLLFSCTLEKIDRPSLEQIFSFLNFFFLGGGGRAGFVCALLKVSRPLYLYFLDPPLLLPPCFLLSFLPSFLPSVVTSFIPVLFFRFNIRSLEFRRRVLRCTFWLINKMIQFWNTDLICKKKKQKRSINVQLARNKYQTQTYKLEKKNRKTRRERWG